LARPNDKARAPVIAFRADVVTPVALGACVQLRTGTTVGVNFPPDNPVANADQDGFDRPRSGQGATASQRRAAVRNRALR
jgi:hypothetical protein